MKKIIASYIASFYFVLSALFIATVFTSAYLLDNEISAGNTFTATTWTVATTPVAINEVYYDVDPAHGNDGGADSNEWIELYNNTSSAIPLEDWTVSDNTVIRTIGSNVSIPAKGFALISKSVNTWSYWIIPADAEKINLAIGDLSNSGDRLILRDSLNNIIDQISYGTDTTILNPSISDVPEGHSISRSPNGKDTDNAGDFINSAAPTPGS